MCGGPGDVGGQGGVGGSDGNGSGGRGGGGDGFGGGKIQPKAAARACGTTDMVPRSAGVKIATVHTTAGRAGAGFVVLCVPLGGGAAPRARRARARRQTFLLSLLMTAGGRQRHHAGGHHHHRLGVLSGFWLVLTPVAHSYPALPVASRFEPSYEWTNVPDDASIPAGLEVKLVLQPDEATGARRPKVARIPPSWRLQLWLDDFHIFARVDVARDTRLAQVEEDIAKQAMAHRTTARDCVTSLWSNGARLPPGGTAEQADLFGKQRTLVAKLACE